MREGQERREKLARWLHAQGLREVLNGDEELAELRKLLSADTRGFGILWSMIAFERARAMVELSNLDFDTETRRHRAAVLQGTIRCVDVIREIVLGIADPPVDAAPRNSGEGTGDLIYGYGTDR